MHNIAAQGLSLRRARRGDRQPLGGDPPGAAATCWAPGSSCASATRPSPRSTAGPPQRARPASPVAACPATSCTSSSACRASTARATRRTWPTACRTRRQDRGAWRGQHAPKVRLLPRRLPYEELPALDGRHPGRAVPIGVNEDALAPVYLDFDADPHFFAFGGRRVRQDEPAAHDRAGHRRAVHAEARPGSCWSTTAADCSGVRQTRPPARLRGVQQPADRA